jgi:hypothetical protein
MSEESLETEMERMGREASNAADGHLPLEPRTGLVPVLTLKRVLDMHRLCILEGIVIFAACQPPVGTFTRPLSAAKEKLHLAYMTARDGEYNKNLAECLVMYSGEGWTEEEMKEAFPGIHLENYKEKMSVRWYDYSPLYKWCVCAILFDAPFFIEMLVVYVLFILRSYFLMVL